jgi:hypothetical protein
MNTRTATDLATATLDPERRIRCPQCDQNMSPTVIGVHYQLAHKLPSTEAPQ